MVEEEKLWLLFCVKSIFMTEPITFDEFKNLSKQVPAKVVKPKNKKSKEELIADTVRINEKLKGKKP
jgi:hypothetical protein